MRIYKTQRPNPFFHIDKHDVALCPPMFFPTGYGIGNPPFHPLTVVLTWKGWAWAWR